MLSIQEITVASSHGITWIVHYKNVLLRKNIEIFDSIRLNVFFTVYDNIALIYKPLIPRGIPLFPSYQGFRLFLNNSRKLWSMDPSFSIIPRI